jgi:hypothetical protein
MAFKRVRRAVGQDDGATALALDASSVVVN